MNKVRSKLWLNSTATGCFESTDRRTAGVDPSVDYSADGLLKSSNGADRFITRNPVVIDGWQILLSARQIEICLNKGYVNWPISPTCPN
jgi:hypothetical protein